MKFKINCFYDNDEQIKGNIPHNDYSDDFVGDFVVAENSNIAIETYKDMLINDIIKYSDNLFTIGNEKDSIVITFCDGTKERYYNFVAKVVNE